MSFRPPVLHCVRTYHVQGSRKRMYMRETVYCATVMLEREKRRHHRYFTLFHSLVSCDNEIYFLSSQTDPNRNMMIISTRQRLVFYYTPFYIIVYIDFKSHFRFVSSPFPSLWLTSFSSTFKLQIYFIIFRVVFMSNSMFIFWNSSALFLPLSPCPGSPSSRCSQSQLNKNGKWCFASNM